MIRRVAELHDQRKQELAEIIMREMGKPIDEAIGEVDFCTSIYGFYADNADELLADEPIKLIGREGSAFVRKSSYGVLLGIMIGRYRLMRFLSLPALEVFRPIPAIAWVPMAIMLWPTNEQSIVFITFLGSFFPILVNTLHGMSLVDPVLVRASQCLGAREMSIFREVYFPASLPHIFTGLTVGMGVAWVSLIAAEMISGQFGIGYFTWEAYSLVQYADIALGMICIGVLGLGSSALIRGLGRLVMPWKRS